MELRNFKVYIAKRRIKQAIAAYNNQATFDEIADYTKYECIQLQLKLNEMLSKHELTKEDKLYILGGDAQ